MSEIVRGTVSDPNPQAAAAFETEQQIKGIVREMQKGWLLLAGALYRFHDAKMWTALGYRTFDEWLASPDVEIKRRHVYGLIEVWRTLVIELGLQPRQLEGIQISKLRDVMPALRRGQVDPETALEDARTLAREDVREKYGLIAATATPAEVERGQVLDAEAEPEHAICPNCGSRYRVMPHDLS